MNPITLLITVVLAAVAAGLITFGEYRHHYADAGPARRAALRAGAFAFAFFFVSSIALVAFFLRTLGPSGP